MAKKRAPEDKKISRSPNKDLETAIANDDGSSYEHDSEQTHRISVCYNAACPDYRRERLGDEKCGCQRRTLGGRV